MRLARVTARGHEMVVIVDEGRREVVVVPADPADSDPIATLLREPRELREAVAARPPGDTLDFGELQFESPLRHPGKIVAVGLNYPDHTAETGFVPPAEPLTFAKYASSLTGAGSQIVVPAEVTSQADYEGELAIVIGRHCPPDGSASLADVAAYAVANDVSARDVQFADKQWTRGKSFDTFTPFGPYLVTADEIDDPQDLSIVTRLNGQVVQADSTASMVFDIETLLRHINSGVRLEPGDVILTGTPAGAGAFLETPSYLTHGDVVEIEIPGIGALRNQVVVPSTTRTNDERN